MENCITFFTVIGQFAYCLRLTVLRFCMDLSVPIFNVTQVPVSAGINSFFDKRFLRCKSFTWKWFYMPFQN